MRSQQSVRVVYESEPQDHGVAARALPSMSPIFLRGLFAKLLPISEDLDSFALDYFASVHRQFSPGMTRNVRENLLLDTVSPGTIYEALRAGFGSKVPSPPSLSSSSGPQTATTLPNPYRGLLVFGVEDAPLFFGRTKKTAGLAAVARGRPGGAAKGAAGSRGQR